MPKKIRGQKYFDKKGSIIFYSKTSDPNNLGPKMLGPKNIFSPSTSLLQNMLDRKNILGPKKFWDQCGNGKLLLANF